MSHPLQGHACWGLSFFPFMLPHVPHRGLKDPQAGCVHQLSPPPSFPEHHGLLILHDWNSLRLGSRAPHIWHQADIQACGQGHLLTPDITWGLPWGLPSETQGHQEAIGLQGTLICLLACSAWSSLCFGEPASDSPSYSASGLACESRWTGTEDLRPPKAHRLLNCYTEFKLQKYEKEMNPAS